MACEAPEDHIEFGGDCDDSDDSVHPAAVEICGDGVDNDCDGQHPSCGHQGELSLSAEESWSPGEGSWGSVAVGSSRVQGGDLAELQTSDPDQATAVLLGVQRDQIELPPSAGREPLRTESGQRDGPELDGYGDLLIGEAQGASSWVPRMTASPTGPSAPPGVERASAGRWLGWAWGAAGRLESWWVQRA